MLGVTSLQTPRAQNREWARLQRPRQCLAQRSCWRWACGVSKGLGSGAEQGWRRGGRTCRGGQHAQGERGLSQASIRDEAASPAGAAATRPPSASRGSPGRCVQKSLQRVGLQWATPGTQGTQKPGWGSAQQGRSEKEAPGQPQEPSRSPEGRSHCCLRRESRRKSSKPSVGLTRCGSYQTLRRQWRVESWSSQPGDPGRAGEGWGTDFLLHKSIRPRV